MTRHAARGPRFDRVMDEYVQAAVGAMGLLMVLILVRLSPSPEAAFVLQFMAGGGAIGLLVAYVRHRDDPDADRWRTVTGFGLIGLGLGLVLVLGERLLFG